VTSFQCVLMFFAAGLLQPSLGCCAIPFCVLLLLLFDSSRIGRTVCHHCRSWLASTQVVEISALRGVARQRRPSSDRSARVELRHFDRS
jgi:hypothetical protein